MVSTQHQHTYAAATVDVWCSPVQEESHHLASIWHHPNAIFAAAWWLGPAANRICRRCCTVVWKWRTCDDRGKSELAGDRLMAVLLFTQNRARSCCPLPFLFVCCKTHSLYFSSFSPLAAICSGGGPAHRTPWAGGTPRQVFRGRSV